MAEIIRYFGESYRELEPGTRVVAYRNIDVEERIIYAFGRGVYEGEFTPEQEFTKNGSLIEPRPYPRIRLNNGRVLWGYESELMPIDEDIADILCEFDVIVIDADNARRESREIS